MDYFSKGRLVLNRHFGRTQSRFLIVLTIFLLLIAGSYTTVFSSGILVANVNQGDLLNLNSLTTQWLNVNGHMDAISLADGKIGVFELQDDKNSWEEIQRLAADDGIAFTTFQVKDINRDGVAEIIAGTMEPGFIYIYKLVDGKWKLFNSGKYVWSTVTYIAVGNFSGGSGNDILVQNQEGSLFLLKLGETSLDLVWKSPTNWRPISSGYITDIDNDTKEEIIVAYKAGGIGIIKLDSNSAVSVWENYLWGKVMAVISGDLDHGGHNDVLISTSQKVIYDLGWNPDKGYQFKKQWTDLDFIAEKMAFFDSRGQSRILASDTAGRTHLLQYDAKNQALLEDYAVLTGRISQIISFDDTGNFLLWGFNRKLINMHVFSVDELQIRYQESDYPLSPAVVFKKDTLYIAPKGLQSIPGLNITYQNNKTTYIVMRVDQVIEVNKKNLAMKVNGTQIVNGNAPIVVDGEIFLPLSIYVSIFKLNLTLNMPEKRIMLNEGATE
jgi:hypothetical protein